jgi:hypothetical protein
MPTSPLALAACLGESRLDQALQAAARLDLRLLDQPGGFVGRETAVDPQVVQQKQVVKS